MHKTIYFVNNKSVLSTKSDNLIVTSQYQGDWRDDMRHGFGDFVYKNGDLYSG